MGAKYIPQHMIEQSRFIDLYKEWYEEDRVHLTDKMNCLIRENSEYTDTKNYGHMCNLLTALAIIMVLEDKGMSRKEAQQYTADAMYLFIKPQIRSIAITRNVLTGAYHGKDVDQLSSAEQASLNIRLRD